MQQRKDCEYMLLDGMPVVVGPDKTTTLVFTINQKWEPMNPKDEFSAVYPNFSGWWDYKFANLPEPPLPEAA